MVHLLIVVTNDRLDLLLGGSIAPRRDNFTLLTIIELKSLSIILGRISTLRKIGDRLITTFLKSVRTRRSIIGLHLFSGSKSHMRQVWPTLGRITFSSINRAHATPQPTKPIQYGRVHPTRRVITLRRIHVQFGL